MTGGRKRNWVSRISDILVYISYGCLWSVLHLDKVNLSCRVNVTGTVLETPSLGSLLPVGTAAPADFSGWQGLGQSQEERERHSAGSPGWLWWLAGLDGPLTIQLEDLVLLFFSLHSGHLSTPSEDKHQAGNGELREGMNELTHTCLCWSCEQASSLQRGRRYMYSLGSPPPASVTSATSRTEASGEDQLNAGDRVCTQDWLLLLPVLWLGLSGFLDIKEILQCPQMEVDSHWEKASALEEEI